MTESIQLTRAEKFVKYALDIGAIEFPSEGWILHGGRISPYYFNTGKFHEGDSARTLANAFAATIEGFRPEVVFGWAYKGIPLASTVVMALGGKVGYAFNRKEEKDHGEGGDVVGAPLSGKRVLIVDDAMTTGKSSGEAVGFIRAHGGIPIGCVIAFDRQERIKEVHVSAVKDFYLTHQIPVRAIATLADLLSFLRKTTNGCYEDSFLGGKWIGEIIAYQRLYGAA